jgi:hypothetical protein
MRVLDEVYLESLFATGGDVEGNTIADRLCAHIVAQIGTFPGASEEDKADMFLDLDDLMQRTPVELRASVFQAVCSYAVSGV